MIEKWSVVSGRWSEYNSWLEINIKKERRIMAVQSYRQLITWQKSMELVKYVYELTAKFPREELYGLTSQIRRAAVSVPSNIAEGQGRNSTKEFPHHISIAYGSLMETETQGLISQMLGYITAEETNLLLEKSAEVGRLKNRKLNSLERKLYSRQPPTTDNPY
jgi:four helix bundle protein